MDTQVTQANQPSGAPASVFTQPITEADLDFSRLDRTVDRYRLLLLAKRVGKEAGFTPRMLQLLEYYLAFTTAKDWEEGSRPTVFQSLARTAMDLGVGERQIQKLEKRLFDVGAICWRDSGNHKRYGRRCTKSGRLLFAYGVDLTPLAYLEEELQAKLHEKQLYAEAWRGTKREISETRRLIRERLQQLREEGVDATVLARFEAGYREIAFELRSHIDLSRLRSLLKHHQSLLEALKQAWTASQAKKSQPLATSIPIAPPARNRSFSHAQKFAHQEDTTPIDKKRRATYLAGEIEPLANRPEAIGKTTPQQICRGASPAFQAHLPMGKGQLNWGDLIEAAYKRRAELGISRQSWAEACGVAGRPAAAVCLLLTDKAIDRTANPAKHPDAYFRAVARGVERRGLRL